MSSTEVQPPNFFRHPLEVKVAWALAQGPPEGRAVADVVRVARSNETSVRYVLNYGIREGVIECVREKPPRLYRLVSSHDVNRVVLASVRAMREPVGERAWPA